MLRVLLFIAALFFFSSTTQAQNFACNQCLFPNDCDNDGVPTPLDCDDTDPLMIDETVVRVNGGQDVQCIGGGFVPYTPTYILNCGLTSSGNIVLPPLLTSGDKVDLPIGCSGQILNTVDGVTFHGRGANAPPTDVKFIIQADNVTIQDMNIQNVFSPDVINVQGNVGPRISGFVLKGNRLANNGSPLFDVGTSGGSANLDLHSTDGAIIRNNVLDGPEAISGDANTPNLFNLVTWRSNSYTIEYNHFLWTNRPSNASFCVGAKHGNGISSSCIPPNPTGGEQLNLTCEEDVGGGVFRKNVFETNCPAITGQGRDTWENNYFKPGSGGFSHQNRGGVNYVDQSLLRNNTIVGDDVTFDLRNIYYDQGVRRLGPITFTGNVVQEDSASANGGDNIINYAPYVPDISANGNVVFNDLASYPPVFENNCYWNTGGNTLFGWGQRVSGGGGPSGGSCTFAEWQTNSANCPLSLDQSSFFQNPNLDACGCTTPATTSDCANTAEAGWCIRGTNKTVSISVTDSVLNEDTGNGSILLSFTSPVPVGGVNVYMNTGGAATKDVDYIIGTGATSLGTLTNPIVVPEGVTTFPIPITVVGDSLDESDETFSLTLAGTDDLECLVSTTNNSVDLEIIDNDDSTTTTTTTTTMPGNLGSTFRNYNIRKRLCSWYQAFC